MVGDGLTAEAQVEVGHIAVHRGLDLGELQVELRRLQLGFGAAQLGILVAGRAQVGLGARELGLGLQPGRTCAWISARLGLVEVGLVDVVGRLGAVERALGDVALLDQLGRALEVRLGLDQLGLGALYRGLRLLDLRAALVERRPAPP